MLQIAFRIDNKGSAKSDSLFFNQHAVSAGSLMVGIRQMGKFQLAQAAFLPGLVAVNTVGRSGDNLGARLFKLFILFIESFNFSRTNKSKIEGVKEQYNPLSFVIRQLHFFKFAVRQQRLALKIRSFLSYLY